MLPYNDSEHLYLMYDGPFNIETISTLAKSLQDNTIATEHVRKKLYRVFIELVQNVALYSGNKILLARGTTVGKGKVFVHYINDGFTCTTINKIIKEHGDILVENCNNINAASSEYLRNKKKRLREVATFQDTGAHIGLIMIALYSGNPLQFEVINDKSTGDTYFKISASIYKKAYK
jgi:hypothetical protein